MKRVDSGWEVGGWRLGLRGRREELTETRILDTYGFPGQKPPGVRRSIPRQVW